MKNILFLILLISGATYAQTPKDLGPYTPMTGRSYQFKYMKVDSGFNSLKTAHFADTLFAKGFTQINQTPPLGDSTTRAANTKFVMRAVANAIGGSGGACYGLTQPGNVSWVSGLTFFVTVQSYKINCESYESDTTTLTITSDPTLPMWYLIAVDTFGNAVAIAGVASVTPVQPLPDPNTQLGLAYIYLEAGATVPTGVFNTVVYDENIEWTGSGDYTGLDFNYTTNPLQGTKSTFVSGGSGTKFIRYTNASDLNISDYATLKFYIRLNTSFSGTTNMTVNFMNNGSSVSSLLILGTAQGFNRSLTGSYQVISIPISSFSFSASTFDAIQFRTTASVPSFQLDNVILQTGLTTITNTGVTSFAGRTGAVNPIKADYNAFYMDTVYALNDTVLVGRKNGVTFNIPVKGRGGVGGSTDTTSLSNRINLKLNISDTLAMLAAYQTAINNNALAIAGKQATLVSGTNIKTVNGNTLLGSGDLTISGGGSVVPEYYNILITGQSNAWGASGATAHDTVSNPRVLIWQHAQATPAWVVARINQRPFRTLGYNAVDGTATRDDLNGSANSAFYMAKRLAIEHPNDTIRIIMAIGDGRNSSFWFDGVTRGRYTDSLIDRAAASGITKTDVFIWDQGESDGALSEDTYISRLDSVKATLRRQSWFAPTTPMVFSGLPRVSYGASPANVEAKDSTLRKFDYNADYWNAYGNTDNLTISTDNVHFSGGSLDTLGRIRYYQAWKSLPKRHIELSNSLAIAASSGANWGVTGNSGTVEATNFIGTIDNIDLMFRRSNSFAGRIDSSAATTGMTLFGVGTGRVNTGVNNSGFGFKALGSNTSGADNAAFGNRSFASNLTGGNNTGIGVNAGLSSTSSHNTYGGYYAGGTATSGADNSTWGSLAMSNYTGSRGVGVGKESLEQGAGNDNTALGNKAMGDGNNSGGSNTAIGSSAGLINSSGTNNIFLGAGSGANSTTASNQIFINSVTRGTGATIDQNRSAFYGLQNATILNQVNNFNGKLGVNNVSPTAWLHLPKGTTVAATSPLKFEPPVSLTTTAASGTGTAATITFASTTNPPFVLGSTITVSGVTPAGYNGTFAISEVTPTSVTYINGTTGVQTVAGTITQGSVMTTPENGAVEFDGTDYYATSGSTRYKLQRVGIVPATASSTGVSGTIAFDATHFYVCVATNTWVRTTLATW